MQKNQNMIGKNRGDSLSPKHALAGMKTIAKIASASLATLLLAACGSGLNGTYTDSAGVTSITFEPNGKVDIGALGISEEVKYEVDGNKLKIGAKDGPMQIYTIEKDGSILNPLGMKLTKQK